MGAPDGLPDPTIKLIGWAATLATEAILNRVTDRIASKLQKRACSKVRQRAVAVVRKRGRGAA